MTDEQELLELLKKAECFDMLQSSSLDLVSTRMRRETFEPGDTICTEGDPADWMFVVIAGDLSVIKQAEGVPPVEISTLTMGDVGGLMSLFEAEVRSATLKAKSTVELGILDHLTFSRLLQKDKDLAFGILTYMSQRTRRDSEVLAKLQALSGNTD